MLTAHLPSGYVLARAARASDRPAMAAALIGAVLPDVDLVYYFFVDHAAANHHSYWTHIPAFWAAVAVVALPALRHSQWRRPAGLLFAGIALHLILDSLVGRIMWLAPFSDRLFSLFTVPANGRHWAIAMMLHWTFLAEIAIWIVAGAILMRRRKRGAA